MCRIMEEFAKEEREEKAIENAVTLVKDYNETPKVAAKKMGAPLDKLLEALKQSTDK